MATTKYDALVQLILDKCLPMAESTPGVPFLIEINLQGMKLSTIRKGLLNAKSNWTKAGNFPPNYRLVFHDEKLVSRNPNFTGLAVSLELISRGNLCKSI